MTKDNAVIQQYSSGCEEAAQQTGVQFIELYNAMMKQEVSFFYVSPAGPDGSFHSAVGF